MLKNNLISQIEKPKRRATRNTAYDMNITMLTALPLRHTQFYHIRNHFSLSYTNNFIYLFFTKDNIPAQLF